MSQALRILVEVDGEPVMNYEQPVQQVSVSHGTPTREVPWTPDQGPYQQYEKTGEHHIVIVYTEEPK